MGCVRETKKFLKAIWEEVSPEAIRFCREAILMFDDLHLSNREKAELVAQLVRMREPMTERLSNLVVEYVLNAVRADGVDDSELGQDDGINEAIG